MKFVSKRKIIKNLLAFIIVVGSILMAHFVWAQNFGTNFVNNGLAGSLSAADPRVLVSRIINIALGFLGVIAVSLIMYAGFLWMTSNGEEEKITTAKNILKNSAIGLAIILASWGIATFILSSLGGGGNNGGGGACYNGEISACGCGGSMICSNGSYGGCLGSNCNGGGTSPTSCDGNLTLPGCQATDQICAASDYCDHSDCGCKPKGGLGDSCNASSNATCQADNTRCAQYLTCNTQTCTCEGPPVITGVSPVGGFCIGDPNKSCNQNSDCPSSTCNLTAPNGAPNNLLTISGTNFGAYSATSSQVVFEGSAANSAKTGQLPNTLNGACLNTWSNTQIVIAVPAGVTSGPIKVTNKDNLSDVTNDAVGPIIPDFQANVINRPGLCNLSPVSGVLSSAVGYSGVNLYNGSAYFGNYQTNVQALQSNFSNPAGLTGTSTIPNIQTGTSGSFVQSDINGTAEKSNYLSFTKEADANSGPFISSFSPVSGNSGQYVTIYGSGFGGARGANHVYFGSAEAAYDFPAVCLNSVWSDKQIVVKVPAGLTNGSYPIKISLGATVIGTQNLNPNAFQFDNNSALETSLCKIDPNSGPAYTPVSLWGEYFGSIGSNGLVKFNQEQPATGTIQQSGQADLIQTTVPAGAISGPVKVINNSNYGNALNFAVGACTTNADCGTQVCCPQNTYKKGQCVNTLADCLINIPTSVFQWNFSTGFSTSTYGYSCSGLAKYYGSCQTGDSCPNVPGTCSPSAGGTQSVGQCDSTCASVPGCNNLAPNNCTYDSIDNVCLKNGGGATCDLSKTLTYTVNGNTASTTEACNSDGQWEVGISSTCPAGWSKTVKNTCVMNVNPLDPTTSCSICSANLHCQALSSSSNTGSCVSAPICPAGATCQPGSILGQDQCVAPAPATCACCCPISPDPVIQAKNDQQNCCSFTNKTTGQTGQLTCQGRCGSDIGKTTPATLGKCGGCAAAGNTAAERDAACNCTGHSGQYCDTTNSMFPSGVCTDCSDLSSKQDCNNHSSACCLDAKKTNSSGVNICRGGLAISPSTASSLIDVGYCAYYNCQTAPNSSLCATSTPVANGSYTDPATCTGQCLKVNQCSSLTSLSACSAAAGCCYDAHITNGSKCRSGNPINVGSNNSSYADNGYCAYYDCQASPNGNLCATSTPDKNGPISNNSIAACTNNCANPPYGPNLSCAGKTPSTCAANICNFPKSDCLSPTGQVGVVSQDCGTCCCQPGATITSPSDPSITWTCLANKGACTGTSRGLFCGCQSDSECGSPDTIGCGSDTCCESRPEIASSSPAHLATNVCRNSLIKVTFNTAMDPTSFSDNVLLLEEQDYGNGICPAGTFLTSNNLITQILALRDKNWLERLWDQAVALVSKLTGHFSGSALAGQPDPSKLYCSIPGMVYGENSGSNTSLVFAPQKLLDPSAHYYLVVKGDEGLNSKTGVLSAKEVGFKGLGYYNPSPGPSSSAYISGADVYFNKKDYINSQIIEFNTLSSQGPDAGVCAVDNVQVSPSSYLFQTTDNALTSQEDDSNAASTNKTFDTVADRDKVFTASAYSADGQSLQPVPGYDWTWSFGLDSSKAVATSTVPNLSPDKTFVTAQTGVTDGEVKLTATINMSKFNAIQGGDGFNNSSDIYVFICNNPWPPVGPNGSWSPWADTCQGSLSGSCSNYNYKFYYCRDSGTAGTQDDLPAIMNQAVTLGTSNSLVCSTDNTPCTSQNSSCGLNNSGLCILSVLKESYFFREPILSSGQIIDAIDQKTGGAVKVDWQSAAGSQVGSYKIYYLPSGHGTLLSQEVPAASACQTANGINTCSTIINGLTNNTPYIFQVSVVSVNKTESSLSVGVTATPTDQTPPAVPVGFNVQLVASSSLKFSWTANTDGTVLYRLYHGVASGQYGESFDSASGATTQSFPLSQFTDGDNYFALTAVDTYKNESAKSSVVSYIIPPATPGGLKAEMISTSTVQISWKANNDNTTNYRLYLGATGRVYDQTFNSSQSSTSLNLPLSTFSQGNNYLAVTALDAYSESVKSLGLICAMNFLVSPATFSCQ